MLTVKSAYNLLDPTGYVRTIAVFEHGRIGSIAGHGPRAMIYVGKTYRDKIPLGSGLVNTYYNS